MGGRRSINSLHFKIADWYMIQTNHIHTNRLTYIQIAVWQWYYINSRVFDLIKSIDNVKYGVICVF